MTTAPRKVLGSRAAVAIAAVIVTAVIGGGVASASVRNNSVTSAKIRNNTVLGIDIRNGTIKSIDIGNNSVTSVDIADGTVTTTDIADGSVTTDDIADGSVTTDDIADGSIVGADLDTGAVGSAEVLDGSITAADVSAALQPPLWALVDADADTVACCTTSLAGLIAGNGVVSVNRFSAGVYTVLFNRSITSCALLGTLNDLDANGSNAARSMSVEPHGGNSSRVNVRTFDAAGTSVDLLGPDGFSLAVHC